MLGEAHSGGCEPLQLAGGDRALPRVLEGVDRLGLAAPRLEPAEHDERRTEADTAVLAHADRGVGVGLRLRPLTPPQTQVRAGAEEVLDVAVEIALGGERDRALEVALDPEVVAAAHERAGREVHERAGRVIVLPRLDGARVRVLEHGPAPLVVDAPPSTAVPTFVSACA